MNLIQTPINFMKIAKHQTITMPGGLELDQPNSKGVKAGGSNMQVELVDEVMSDLLQEVVIVTRMQHAIHIHRNGELLVSVDGLA
jgi:hypothetical protein